MRQFLGSRANLNSPRGQAEELVAQGFEEPDPQRQVELAKEALAHWPDCADAYMLLAENAPTRKEALRLYEQGVQAGEQALGPDGFRQHTGNFWAMLETRHYMRAREGLAHALWAAGRRQEAVEHLHEMLRMNPHDNQCVRYTLAGFLLFLDRDDDLVRLLGQFADDASATWMYTKALVAFRQIGETPQTLTLLKGALPGNRHIPDYLLERKLPLAPPPGYYSTGPESEAFHYVGSFLAAWRSTAGAIAWLRANDPEARKRQEQTPTPWGPLPLVKNWLKRKLPQEGDVWQADVRLMPNAIRVGGRSRSGCLDPGLDSHAPNASVIRRTTQDSEDVRELRRETSGWTDPHCGPLRLSRPAALSRRTMTRRSATDLDAGWFPDSSYAS